MAKYRTEIMRKKKLPLIQGSMAKVIQLKYYKAKYEKSMCPAYNKPPKPNIVISKCRVGFNLHKSPRRKTHFIMCPGIFLLYL